MDARLAGIAVVLLGLSYVGSTTAPIHPASGRGTSGEPLRWSFDLDLKGSLPPGAAALSGIWGVRPSADAPSRRNALCQLGTVPFAALSLADVTLADVVLTARFKSIAGREDQAAGLLLRLQDQDNYYVLRADAFENSISFSKHADGRPITLKEVKAPVAPGQWQGLHVEAVGSRFRGFLNSEPVLEVTDDSYRAGQVGLWTKADSLTCFDDVEVRTL
jgi:hypothetical protein